MMWTHEEAVELCRRLEEIAPAFGGHVALTGGTLYKDGLRKDVDILIYRSADEPEFKWDEFFVRAEAELGICLHADYGWCKKAITAPPARAIDFFDPFKGGDKTMSTAALEDWLK